MSAPRPSTPPSSPVASPPRSSAPVSKADQKLIERYRTAPAAFDRSTRANLLVALALLALGAVLAYMAAVVVGLRSGGLALVTMAIFPVLLALAALDDVRWRRALVQRRGVPPPPSRPLRSLLRVVVRPARASADRAPRAGRSPGERTATPP